MKVKTGFSIKKDTKEAIAEAVEKLGDISPNLLIMSGSCLYDYGEVQKAFLEKYPSMPFQAATSCLGSMSNWGVHQDEGHGLSLFAIEDNEGSYGTGMGNLEKGAFEGGVEAIEEALKVAGRGGESPDAIWLMAAPGSEEEVIRGVESVIGKNIPIIGGSAGDNTIEGNWFLCTQKEVGQNHVTVAVFYTNSIVTTAFHSGYDSTQKRGLITKAEGRVIKEIDNKPAAEVFNRWTDGAISEFMKGEGNILAATGLHPLGREVGTIQGIPYFKLSHPETVNDQGELSFFTDMTEGEEVVSMVGSIEGITKRAKNVFEAAMDVEQLSPDDVCGALSTFCAGCMLTIGDEVNDANNFIQGLLRKDTPYISSFTFGEQGQLPGGENCHGNLMISVLLFTNKK